MSGQAHAFNKDLDIPIASQHVVSNFESNVEVVNQFTNTDLACVDQQNGTANVTSGQINKNVGSQGYKSTCGFSSGNGGDP